MGDLISRQAAIEAFNTEIMKRRLSEDTNDDGSLDEFDTESILRALPSAQSGWIPCSEQPPEKSEWYLLTAEWDDGLTTVMKDRYVVGEGWTCAVFGAKCLAWQSLPTPYREGRQDDH